MPTERHRAIRGDDGAARCLAPVAVRRSSQHCTLRPESRCGGRAPTESDPALDDGARQSVPRKDAQLASGHLRRRGEDSEGRETLHTQQKRTYGRATSGVARDSRAGTRKPSGEETAGERRPRNGRRPETGRAGAEPCGGRGMSVPVKSLLPLPGV